MAASAQKPMVVRPAEPAQAGKLDAEKRLLGRVVSPEHVEGSRFSCYLACGPSTRDLLVVEAWLELAGAADALFVDQRILSVTHATLSRRQPAKSKLTHSHCGLFIRFDKTTRAEPEEAEGEATLPDQVPVTLLHRAACLNGRGRRRPRSGRGGFFASCGERQRWLPQAHSASAWKGAR